MDQLKLACDWNKPFQHGLGITGLYIQGAKFDGTRLSEVNSDDPNVSKLPTLFISWIPKVSCNVTLKNSSSMTNYFDVNLYADLSREQLLSVLHLPHGSKEDTWIMASVAVFLNVDGI